MRRTQRELKPALRLREEIASKAVESSYHSQKNASQTATRKVHDDLQSKLIYSLLVKLVSGDQRTKPALQPKKALKRDSETESEDNENESQVSAGEELEEDASDPDEEDAGS